MDRDDFDTLQDVLAGLAICAFLISAGMWAMVFA